MTIDRLKASLADRYRIERELGAGGMATVYLAQDLKHERPVAIKVLRPELAAAVGAERFLREIKVTANLRHANILPLFDSGQAGEFLYYVMPYIEGEMLRDRIDREKQLPLDDVLRISGEVADALSYAHGKGVVHRDIKPENILLENGHAVVADFGIARALSSAGTTSLTETGMAIGTPAYMSPEQASGEHDLDGRTDCYALGCVTYEMLAGQPPFTGPTAQSIVGQHLGAAPRLVTEIRAAVPATVAQAVQRALAKAPADRFSTLSEFKAALGDGKEARGREGEGARRWPMPVGITALVLGAVWFGALRFRVHGPALDANVIAVLPFRVGGGPSIEYLRESMLDLLQARLSSTTGPRTVEPRTLLAAWHRAVSDPGQDLSEEDSRALARTLGAGRVLLGSAVATPTELTLSGTLIQVNDGAVLARENVVGSPDSIAILVNRLTAALLIREAGESEDRQGGLASAPLDALQDYLAGRRAYRRGDFFGAMTLYDKALARDSSFVEAAFRMATTNAWIGTIFHTEGFEAVSLVYRLRDRLSERDRALFLALPMVGPNFPAPSSRAEVIAQAERATSLAPDDPEPLLLLGQLLALYGAGASEPKWARRSAERLDRAIALDSGFTRAVEVRLGAALQTNDTLAMTRYAALLERAVDAGYGDPFMLWATARQREDSAAARHWRDKLAALGHADWAQAMVKIALHSAQFALPMDDARWAVDQLTRGATREEEEWAAVLIDYAVHFAEGRAIPKVSPSTDSYGPGWATSLIQQGTVDAGYRELAASVIARDAGGAYQYNGMRWPPVQLCSGALFRVAGGDRSGVDGALRGLRAFAATTPPPLPPEMWGHLDQRVCPLLLELLGERPPPAGMPWPHLDELDSLMRAGPDWFAGALSITATVMANYTVARLRESQGDIPAALAAIRRRDVDYFPPYLWSLPAFLRQEGRLAALAGDTTGALQAYDKYLTLRAAPEPPFQPQRDSVVAERALLLSSPHS